MSVSRLTQARIQMMRVNAGISQDNQSAVRPFEFSFRIPSGLVVKSDYLLHLCLH
jgi:hypothetical protein